MKPKVLVINHDELLLSLMDELLSEEGLDVTTDQIDGACIERIHELRPEALVAGLAPLDGRIWDFLRSLAADHLCRYIPTILLTTSETLARRLEASPEYPMVEKVLLKPFDLETFLNVLNSAIAKGQKAAA